MADRISEGLQFPVGFPKRTGVFFDAALQAEIHLPNLLQQLAKMLLALAQGLFPLLTLGDVTDHHPPAGRGAFALCHAGICRGSIEARPEGRAIVPR